MIYIDLLIAVQKCKKSEISGALSQKFDIISIFKMENENVYTIFS